nr:TnpV protein [uncultured Bacillus sp.]
MANDELEYTEVDGLLYPNIEIEGKAEIENLEKYGLLRITYLHVQKLQMHRN